MSRSSSWKGFDKGDLDETVQADFVATAYTMAEGTPNESAKQFWRCTK